MEQWGDEEVHADAFTEEGVALGLAVTEWFGLWLRGNVRERNSCVSDRVLDLVDGNGALL